MDTTTLSIVLPVYNEVKTISQTIERVIQAPLPPGWQKELIIIDDGSTDGTRDHLSDLASSKGLKLILKEKNEGKGSALKVGFAAAQGEWIIIQDADSEYDPNEYTLLIQPIIKGEAMIVMGSRNMDASRSQKSGWTFYLGGLFLNQLFNTLFGSRFTDIHTCYKIFPASLTPRLIRFPDQEFAFDAVNLTYTLLRSGFKIREVPISYTGRKHDEGKKIKFRHGWACIWEMLKTKLRHG